MLRSGVQYVSWTAITALALIAWSGHSGTRTFGQDQGKPQGKLKELLKERAATAREAAQEALVRSRDGRFNFDELVASQRLWLEAELDACESAKERIAALEKFLPVAKESEKMATERVKGGIGLRGSALTAKAERLRIEIMLERAKAKPAAQAPQDLQDELELAKKRAAIKRAAVKVVEAQKARVVANLGIAKADVEKEKADESFAEAQMKRIEALAKANAVDAALRDEHRAKFESARARRNKAESALKEADSQIAIEDARIVQAQLEAEEAELRVKHLNARPGN